MLGQYEIVGYVGKGGMATVYRGMQKSINRTVAIKVLPRNFTHDDTFMTRFRREAALVAQLEHPHIMPIYDYGEYDDMPYIVMRYVDGGSLHERIRAGNLTFDDIVSMTTQIASALDYAHANNILHRDVKPSNVLLDSRGNAYLTDFGLARLEEGTGQLTGSNIVGTPAYIAPEQAEMGPQGPAMDIYSLGVSIFEMLTGRIPYAADTPIAQILMHVQRPVPSARIANPHLPLEADIVLRRAMAKRPTERYRTAGALAEALESALMEPHTHREPTDGDRIATPLVNPELPDIDFVVEADPRTETVERTPTPEPIPTPVVVEPVVMPHEAPTEQPARTIVQPKRSAPRGRGRWIAGLVGLAFVIAAISFFATQGGPPAATTAEPTASPAETEIPVVVPTTDEAASASVEPSSPPTEASSTQPPTTEPTPTAEPSATEVGAPTALPEVLVQNGIDMRLVPQGEFTMGSREGQQYEAPVHTVFLNDYYIDRNEVTIEAFQRCVDLGACALPTIVRSRTRSQYYGQEQFNTFPVVNITWFEAERYCEWRGSRLPTEAQWEKAARWDPQSSTAREVPWNVERELDRLFLNYGAGDTVAVGSFPEGQSAYGVNDMAGNVAEWVYDWFGEDFYQVTPFVDPVGPTEGTEKVHRGGSYANLGAELLTWARRRAVPDSRIESVGFRCAYTPGGLVLP
jgi:serine/threonine protein kinase